MRLEERQWEIDESQQACAACKKPFADGQEQYSALYEVERGLERRDYCLECWAKEKGGPFSFWKRRFKKEKPRRRKFIDNDSLLDFFHRMRDAAEARSRNFAYIVGLILLRKKLFRLEGTERSPSGEVMLLRERSSDNLWRVERPELTEAEIEQLASEVGQILESEP